jgi:hypothetical protein
MSCDHSLGRKVILKFILLFHDLFECNNVIILSLIIFCLNYNRHVNSHRYIQCILKSYSITHGYQLV